MSNKNEEKSFWSTVPGILTGIAAIISAIGGLVLALNAAGLITIPPLGPTPTPTPLISTPTPTPQNLLSFEEQASYAGDCGSRPAGSVCIEYEDGYVWLVYDSILGWGEDGTWQGKKISVAKGFKADYHHVLGTLLVKQVPK